MITFEDGRLGIFHWTDVGYNSPLRWWRSSRFLAEKGMGISTGVGIDIHEQLTLLSPDRQAPQWITVETQYERVDGGADEGGASPMHQDQADGSVLGARAHVGACHVQPDPPSDGLTTYIKHNSPFICQDTTARVVFFVASSPKVSFLAIIPK